MDAKEREALVYQQIDEFLDHLEEEFMEDKDPDDEADAAEYRGLLEGLESARRFIAYRREERGIEGG